MSRLRLSVAGRIALAVILVTGITLAVVVVGVLFVGHATFYRLMTQSGAGAAETDAMFADSVAHILLGAVAIGLAGAVLLALLFARLIERPLADMGDAARRLSVGGYRARVKPSGAPELAALAVAFNQMAESLEHQEQVRRDFVAGAAHELLTPLTNLVGYLEGMRDGVIPASPEAFASLREEAERLVRLSKSLLALAEDSARDLAAGGPADVSGAVRGAAKLAQPACERSGTHLNLDLDPDLFADADSDHITQVIFNLLQNACRYSTSGGEITVRAQRQGEMVMVSVSNPGAAIPVEHLPRLFERFYRVEPSRDRGSGGAGLGLAIVKQLVEAAGGRVGVESQSGRTRFWFTLPALTAPGGARPGAVQPAG